MGFWRSKRISEWNKFASLDQQSPTGYIGLENLGCTCYMNSLLQQFNNISIIREGILSTTDSQIQIKEESYLYQIKKIFAFLKKTDKKFHNPKDFTNIFKNYDGQVMNVTEQMDVDEFYNLLIDRLEPYLKSKKYENLFKFIFSGTISNEIIGKNDCKHYSERIEIFQSIILQVKNKKNIDESLEAFISGEMMEGENSYNCEKCEKKVTALKRQCFKKLPNVLTLVLKRFEYDYDTMQKNKINDYCEFPLELNMYKYSQEFLNKKNEGENVNEINNINTSTNNAENNNTANENNPNSYMYDLTGVVIHTGTTERGHYYSFTKKDNGNWYEFNDTNVTNFNIEDMEDEAFGGTQYYYNNKTGKNEMIEKSTNAYVLFYTKKDAIKIEEEFKNKMDLEISANCNNNEDIVFNSLLKNADNDANIQSDIVDSIKIDNFKYWVSKAIFSNEYINFVKDVLINYNSVVSKVYNFSLLGKTQFCHLDNMKNSTEEFIEKFFEESNNIDTNSSIVDINSISNYEYTSNQINFGFSNKIENYVFENVRIHRYKKSINSIQENLLNNNNNNSNNSNSDSIDLNFISEGNSQNQKEVETYLKKVTKIYSQNSDINKSTQIITNQINSKNQNSTNCTRKESTDFNPIIPNEREPQIPNEIPTKKNQKFQIQISTKSTSENSNQNPKNTNINTNFTEIKNLIKNSELDSEIFKFCVFFFFTNAIRLKEKITSLHLLKS